jgi:hypothetical protein
MASLGNWTVVFDDKVIIKQTGDGAGTHKINDDAFWSQLKFSNIWAIHYGTSFTSDEVEYRDETPHSSYSDANLGDFQEFITRWDSTHLAELQSDWDKKNIAGETEAEKIARLGERPTSYTSS